MWVWQNEGRTLSRRRAAGALPAGALPAGVVPAGALPAGAAVNENPSAFCGLGRMVPLPAGNKGGTFRIWRPKILPRQHRVYELP